MYDTRYSRDDLIPMLRDSGIAETLLSWLNRNASQEFLIELVQMEHSIILLTAQIRQIISDLCFVGDLEGTNIEGLPNPQQRPVKPTGIGCSGGNIWVTPPEGNYQLRFYVNSIHKTTLDNYYITSLVTIGAGVGDIVQVASVAQTDVLENENVIIPAGTVSWWTRIVVP